MRWNDNTLALAQVHIAVFLFGFTAILGHLITLPAISLVWWRVLLTCLSLLVFIQWGRSLKNIPPNYLTRYIFIGFLVGLHWICFYGAIKLANASIALICMATTSFFTSFIEPAVLRKKFSSLEVILGLLIIPGMVLIVNSTDVHYRDGIIAGLLAALLAATFAVLNKKYIAKADPYSITFTELGSAWVMISFILAVMWLYDPEQVKMNPPALSDWLYIVILALLCTTLAYVLSLKALKHISAFNSNLIINLEPIYGIMMAAFLLGEHKSLNIQFYTGAAIIIMAVFAYPLIKSKKIKLWT